MSIELNHDRVGIEINTGIALKTAKLEKSQQELEGEMALKLIETANIDPLAVPSGNRGQNINIKV